jgi:hypothetical protein
MRKDYKDGKVNPLDAYYINALDVPFKNFLDVPSFDDWNSTDLENMLRLYVDYRNKGALYIEDADLIG